RRGRVRGARVRARAGTAADRERSAAAADVADGRLCDDRGRRAPAGRRPGDDHPDGDSARRPVRPLHRPRGVLPAALARDPADHPASERELTPYPKIELHVHLEGTIAPETLLAIAGRNGETLPADSVEGLRDLYAFRGFDHFIEVWILTTNCL